MSWNLAEILANNPDMVEETRLRFPESLPDEAGEPERGGTALAAPSPLEQRFSSVWASLGGPELFTEYRFHKQRRWRLDFYHEATSTGIEIEGGTWSNGRHVRGQGYANDCEKYNAATMQGIRVIRMTSQQIESDYIQEVIQWIEKSS